MALGCGVFGIVMGQITAVLHGLHMGQVKPPLLTAHLHDFAQLESDSWHRTKLAVSYLYPAVYVLICAQMHGIDNTIDHTHPCPITHFCTRLPSACLYFYLYIP
eukprot:COSAG05_NODE_1739_length_4161_cov_4.587642_7_plen_104_part_00